METEHVNLADGKNAMRCNHFLQSFLGGLFGPVCEIDVILNDAESRKTAELKTEEGKLEKHYLFYDGESVSGKVSKQALVVGV